MRDWCPGPSGDGTDAGRSYVADWPDLPSWQQGTGADIFEAIEKACS